ncbi:putative AAA+ superfamily ATPase [Desulfohalotomaculum tongense]|uniref:ATP-binding protein n=1 Tax=Desulforadius tongensis TaxID=1216062 RepID=UPI00195A63AA|nr:ATP-binding protein [Desulforadius tongensis]MBM7855654.1 putative AAA+ superfamily ATPase [Desulforadius tongensis]
MNSSRLSSEVKKLTVFRQLLEDSVMQAMLNFLDSGSSNKESAYGELYYKLTLAAEKNFLFVKNGWQNHLLNLILYHDNPFTRQAAFGRHISPSLYRAAEHDLQILHHLFQLDIASPVPWDEMFTENNKSEQIFSFTKKIIQSLVAAKSWENCVHSLIDYYSAAGAGIFGRYHTLRWDGERCSIVGVNSPDPVKLTDLIGYQRERQTVLDNTEAFLSGKTANNVLLYGDRGTGKSSTVKALANAYGEKGLRLIEIPKQYLSDFPVIINKLSNRAQYFILFVDDLSFEDFEVEYKTLKAVLEGGVEARPKNVLIYATSNRRHLIRESFSERQQDDVHAADTMQEKLSLSDRFGLVVTFSAPGQKQYLEIVEGLAKQRGLRIKKEELHRRALQWALNHSGRSGRTARQFIDYLTGSEFHRLNQHQQL